LTDLPVVSDASPLIGLARVGHLDLLRRLYDRVQVPPQVFEELQISENRPGSRALRTAVEEGWLEPVLLASGDLEFLTLSLGPGEAAAILLAGQRPYRFLLLDDRRGREVAKRRGLVVIGTGGVLLAAKGGGLIDSVSGVLDRLAATGYRLSRELRNRVLALAGEGEEA